MFNDGDAERLSQTNDRIPDGVYDASMYAQILSDVFEYIKNINSNDFSSNILFMMNCMNLCYEFHDDKSDEDAEFSKERAEDTVTALTYFIMQMLPVIEPEIREDFFRHHEEVVIPETFEQCKALPVYDLSNEVNSILEATSFDEQKDDND